MDTKIVLIQDYITIYSGCGAGRQQNSCYLHVDVEFRKKQGERKSSDKHTPSVTMGYLTMKVMTQGVINKLATRFMAILSNFLDGYCVRRRW